MPKTYIAKALTSLSKRRDGAELCDKLAQRLSNMTSASVRRLNSALDFGWLKWAMMNAQLMMGESRDEVADMRRAALLVAAAFELPPDVKRQAESWESGELAKVFRVCNNVGNYNARGYFLKGSFWGFANHSEREWTEQAWVEAGRLVNAGINVLDTAAADPFGTTFASELLDRYFGGRHNLAAVSNTLTTIQNGMRHDTIGISYEGNGAGINVRYEELREGFDATVLRPTLNRLEVGWSSPHAGPHNTIGFGAAFFIPTETAIRRNTLHDHTRTRMGTTRGGAILHELSHRYAQTSDEILPAATFTYLRRAFQGGVKCYNPYSCWALAQSAPAQTVTNADSYRVFCEDAWVHWH